MIIPTARNCTPTCTLEQEGVNILQAAQECAAQGLSCDTCDFFELVPPECDGNCAECKQLVEGNCLPVDD